MSEKEQRYFDALREIATYLTPKELRRSSQAEYGLDYEEALEMAYENVIATAKAAIRGRKRPATD